jgi:ribosome-binding protein aMBF1 (putative translation factor)
MQTPIKLPKGIKPCLCQICGREGAAVLVYHPRSKRKIGVCKDCAAEDEKLESRYRPGDKWNWKANTGDEEPL